METLIWPVFNFVVFVGLLGYFLRKPAGEFVNSRHVKLKTNLQEVRDLLGRAQTKMAEYQSKLKVVEVEKEAILKQSRSEATAQSNRILNKAQELRSMIVQEANASEALRMNELRAELRGEIGNRIVAESEQLLKERLTQEDHERIRRKFSQQVGSLQQ